MHQDFLVGTVVTDAQTAALHPAHGCTHGGVVGGLHCPSPSFGGLGNKGVVPLLEEMNPGRLLATARFKNREIAGSLVGFWRQWGFVPF